MLTIFFRAIILYIVTLITIRAMGKHQLGQFQPYEFALAIMIADLMTAPMGDISTPLLHGVLPVAALFIVHCLLTFMCLKSDRLRAIISGKPVQVVSRGVIDRKELTKLCMSLNDLLEGMREAGILDPSALGTAIVEADGKISAFTHSQLRPTSPKDLSIHTGYEGMPLALILDGRVQPNNLRMAQRDEAWLSKLLELYNLRPRDVLLMSLSTAGKAHVQDMRGATLDFEAMTAQEVIW